MGLREFLGSYGKSFNLPDIAGSYRGKNVIVCGDAKCIWKDLDAFGCRTDNRVEKPEWDIFAVNKIVEVIPGKIEHVYSHSPDTLERFVRARRDEYIAEFGAIMHLHSRYPGFWVWPWTGHGSSGFGACLTAVALGYDHIVLAGLPLDNGPHNGEPYWRRSHFESSEEAGNPPLHWQRAIDMAFEGKIKSLSGRTREWMGAPR